jgi:hypothetical protein
VEPGNNCQLAKMMRKIFNYRRRSSGYVASVAAQFEQPREPEEKKAKGSTSEENEFSMGSDEGLSSKEQINGKLHEKDISEALEEESGDELADLPTISKARSADSSSSLEGTELDFSVLEGTTRQLNVDANKQKVELRQKGSLAKRRKPTRSSMRSRASEDDLFEDSTVRHTLNGHEEMYVDDPVVAVHEQHMRRISAPVEERSLAAGTNLHGKSPVLLPGLGESKVKLRSKGPVALPPKKRETPADENGEATPPWLSEMRQKRQSRQPPRGEVEKSNEEQKPETPAWMKDALAKKKRATQVMERKQELASKEEPKPTDTSVAPWMRERAQRKSIGSRPSPLMVMHKDVANNNNAANTIDSSNNTSLDNHNETPTKWRSSNSSVINGKEILAPIKRASIDNREADENTPPRSEHDLTVLIDRDELPLKSSLPPLRPSPSQTSVSSTSSSRYEETENDSPSSVPAWRTEIAVRRKSKSFVPVQRPEQPLRLGETPQWKKDLLDRKSRRESIEIKPPVETTSQENMSPTLPAWKQELAFRKKRNSITSRVLEPVEKPAQQQTGEPDWTKQVERRRARLASYGLIPTD